MCKSDVMTQSAHSESYDTIKRFEFLDWTLLLASGSVMLDFLSTSASRGEMLRWVGYRYHTLVDQVKLSHLSAVPFFFGGGRDSNTIQKPSVRSSRSSTQDSRRCLHQHRRSSQGVQRGIWWWKTTERWNQTTSSPPFWEKTRTHTKSRTSGQKQTWQRWICMCVCFCFFFRVTVRVRYRKSRHCMFCV